MPSRDWSLQRQPCQVYHHFIKYVFITHYELHSHFSWGTVIKSGAQSVIFFSGFPILNICLSTLHVFDFLCRHLLALDSVTDDFSTLYFIHTFFLGACSISSNCDASWDTAADRNWSVWMQRLISASAHFMPTNHSRYRLFLVSFEDLTKVHINEIGECTFPAGIPTNPAKPAGYSVRMEASVPLVTQAPPIQPLQIRPGVITQVKKYGNN